MDLFSELVLDAALPLERVTRQSVGHEHLVCGVDALVDSLVDARAVVLHGIELLDLVHSLSLQETVFKPLT